MNSKVALTSFTRDYNYSKSGDIWSSKVHFDKFNLDEFYSCKPCAFFVYSSKFFFKTSKTKTLNLVITLVYDFKPVVIQIIPFNSLVSTCSFAKDPFRPILFVGEEDGHFSILNLNNLDDIQWLKPDFCQKKAVTLADWLNEKWVLFSYTKELYGWNIETGQIDLIYTCDNKNSITYFTCSSFSPNLVAIGFNDGKIVIFSFEKDEKFKELFRLNGHKESICSMSFTIGKGKYKNPILASICQDGRLVVWNLDKQDKIFEDNRLKVSEVKFRFYTVLFMDDLYERSKKKSDLKSINDKDVNLNFMKITATHKEKNYFQLLVTNSNGILQEYKIPKYQVNPDSDFKPQASNFKVLQNKFTKIYSILTPRSFQSILKYQKVQKGDHHKLTNNNNYPIMIQITQKNGCFHFAILDLQVKKQVQTIPLLANAITNVDFNPLRSNVIAVVDMNGFLVWNLPNFEEGNNRIYDLNEQRKGFFRKFVIRVTCLNWSPVKENLLVIGTRTGLILVYNLDEYDPIVNSIQLSQDVHRNPYIYSIYWGPNVLDDRPQTKKKDKKSFSFRQQFDYIYSAVDGGKIVIINLNTKISLNFIDIADIYIEKQWTELSWKSDYTLLAVGNKEGSVDIFSNNLFAIGKLKHIITIDELFKTPIESLVFHPIFIKKNDKKSSSINDNVIAIAGTENTIKIIDVAEYVQKAKIATNDDDLPFISNKIHKVLDDHTERVFKVSWSPFEELQLLSCSEDKTVKVWNCDNSIDQTLIATYHGHFDRVLVAKFSQTEPDMVISGGSDSILAIWKVSEQIEEVAQTVQCSSARTIKPLEFKSLVEEENKNDYNEDKFSTDDESEEEISNLVNSENQQHQIDNKPDLEDHALKEGKLLKYYVDGDRAVYVIEKYNEANEKLTVTHYRPLKNQTKNLTDCTEKSKRRRQAKNKNETKAKSLLTLSTKSDNSLTKLAHYNDIDKMLIDCKSRKKHDLDRTILNAQLKLIDDKPLDSEQFDEIKNERNTILKQLNDLQVINDKNASKRDDEARSTYLFYGNCQDMEFLSKKEIANHLINDDLNSANLVKLLSNDLRTIIDDAITNDQLTETLVAMSASVSLNYWQQTIQTYVEQLIRKGKIVTASCYLLSLFRIGDALDLLVKNRLYKEALMIAKTRFTSDNNVYTQAIVHALARDHAKTGNYESEIKCWLSIDYLYEAARVLASRIDPLSSKYLVRCCKVAHECQLEN